MTPADYAQATERVVQFFEHLTPESLAALGGIYAPDARFRDPFSDVRGLEAIGGIFRHMFDTLHDTRFVVVSRVQQGAQAFLVWEFRFRFRRYRPARSQVIRGATHVLFDPHGRVSLHRDYWDAAEELYEKLPLVGSLMRGLRRLAQPG
jgi:steroid delta-isomerase